MALVETLIGPLASLLDKLIPDKEARARAKLELLQLEGTQELRTIEARLAAIVAAARGHGLKAIDGVVNATDDADRLEAECRQGRAFGFDGKSLIHPNQIVAANAAFSPFPDEVAKAREIVAAFASAGAAGKGAIRVGYRMVERLHLAAAHRLLARHEAASTSPRDKPI